MTNYFDFKFILNLSVSITISLLVVFVFGKVVSDFLSEVFKYLIKSIGKSFLKKVSPIKFSVGFLLNRISSDKFTYEKHKVINFGRLEQSFLPGVGIDLFIQVKTRLPFLYEGEKIRIQLLDSKDLLGIYSAQMLPGKPTTFILGEVEFENTLINHIHIDLKPKNTFDAYKIPINIFFQEKIYREEIQLTVKAED